MLQLVRALMDVKKYVDFMVASADGVESTFYISIEIFYFVSMGEHTAHGYLGKRGCPWPGF